jgi:hypothetical protein
VASKIQLQNPRKNEKRIGESSLKRVIASDKFYTLDIAVTPSGREFFYFHDYGDMLKGQLLGKRSNVNIGRSPSYRIRVEEMIRDGEEVVIFPGKEPIEEFFGNNMLQRTIDKNELIGSFVRIVFIGRQKTGFGHSAKVYDVFKITGIEHEREVRQDGSTRRYKKNRKGSRAAQQ